MKRSELVQRHSNIRLYQMFNLIHHYLFNNRCCFSADHLAEICHVNREAIVEITKLAHEYNAAIKRTFHYSDCLPQIRSILLDFIINNEDVIGTERRVWKLNGEFPFGMSDLINLGLTLNDRIHAIECDYQINRLQNNYTISVSFDSEERPIGFSYVDRMDLSRIDEEDIFYNITLFMFDNHFEDMNISISTTLQLEVA